MLKLTMGEINILISASNKRIEAQFPKTGKNGATPKAPPKKQSLEDFMVEEKI